MRGSIKRGTTKRGSSRIDNALASDIRKAMQSLADTLAADVLQRLVAVSPPPGLGIYADKWPVRMKEWITPLVESAQQAGSTGAYAALDALLLNHKVMRHFASAARSQASRVRQAQRKQRSGGALAPWKNGLRTILDNRRFIANARESGPAYEQIIDRLINDLILDEADDGFYCHEKGVRVAKDKKNLKSEIARQMGKAGLSIGRA